MHLTQLVCSMTSIPKFEGHNGPRRRHRYVPRIRGWSAKPTGLRSSRARPRKKGGSHGLFTTQCEETGGAPPGVNNRHLHLPQGRGAAAQRADGVQPSSAMRQGTGTETMRRSRMEVPFRGPARMPDRPNGSILSLVNRAVKSNIFMRDWKDREFMANTWSLWTKTTEAMCTVCGEYVTTWISPEGNGFCKYCFADRRAAESSAPVPRYMQELIPLE
jgi:hypothetical protein